MRAPDYRCVNLQSPSICLPVPDAWTSAGCPASAYESGDGCDCGCGVMDPDCAASVDVTQDCTNHCGAGTAPVPSDPTQCDAPFWGDGYAQGNEDCDDANIVANDGCDACAMAPNAQCDNTVQPSICATAPEPRINRGCPAAEHGSGGACDCGCGVVDPDCTGPSGDICVTISGCPAGQVPSLSDNDTCVDDTCGDGWFIDASTEECDDGMNSNDADGCTDDCTIVPSFRCLPDLSVPFVTASICFDATGWDPTCASPDGSYFADGFCNCGCGIDDPDCGDFGAPGSDDLAACEYGKVCSGGVDGANPMDLTQCL